VKIFVISMLDSKERRKSIERQFDRVGLEFEFINAVVGKSLSQEEVNQICDVEAIKRNPKYLSKAYIGCTLSHKLAWEKILNADLECALVLEDDVQLPNDANRILQDIPSVIRGDEVILLYYKGFRRLYFSRCNSRSLSRGYEVLSPLDKNSIPHSAEAYVISRGACRSLLKIILPIRVPPDQWDYYLNQHGIGKLSVVYPRPFRDARFQSGIVALSCRSRIVEKFKIPSLYSHLVKRRELMEQNMSRFELVDQVSEFDL